MILNNRFNIEKLSIGFIKYPFHKVRDEIKRIVFESLNKKWKQNDFLLENNFEISSFVQDPDSEVVKTLIWQPKSIPFDLAVFLTNMSDGWQTLLNFYFDKYKREIIRVNFSDELRAYPFYLFEVMAPSNHRIIQAMKDSDEWKFFEKGSILHFENSENYVRQKISNRLNNNIIDDYLKKNEIDINVDDFWESKGNATEFFTRL